MADPNGRDVPFTFGKLLRDQLDYYRDRAPEYDDTYTRTGWHDRGPERNADWFANIADVLDALNATPLRGRCVGLGAGTCWWTEKYIDRVQSVTALDGVPDVLAIGRERLAPYGDKAELDVVNLWTWAPTQKWDSAVACFFLEHVPDEFFPSLLSTLRRALHPGAPVFVTEGAFHQLEPQIEVRSLGGEREYKVVERRRHPDELMKTFTEAGFEMAFRVVGRFVVGSGARDRR